MSEDQELKDRVRDNLGRTSEDDMNVGEESAFRGKIVSSGFESGSNNRTVITHEDYETGIDLSQFEGDKTCPAEECDSQTILKHVSVDDKGEVDSDRYDYKTTLECYQCEYTWDPEEDDEDLDVPPEALNMPDVDLSELKKGDDPSSDSESTPWSKLEGMSIDTVEEFQKVASNEEGKQVGIPSPGLANVDEDDLNDMPENFREIAEQFQSWEESLTSEQEQEEKEHTNGTTASDASVTVSSTMTSSEFCDVIDEIQSDLVDFDLDDLPFDVEVSRVSTDGEDITVEFERV